jgi:hypothetical protein
MGGDLKKIQTVGRYMVEVGNQVVCSNMCYLCCVKCVEEVGWFAQLDNKDGLRPEGDPDSGPLHGGGEQASDMLHSCYIVVKHVALARWANGQGCTCSRFYHVAWCARQLTRTGLMCSTQCTC